MAYLVNQRRPRAEPLNLPHPFEEEVYPHFFQGKRYRVHIGDVLNRRYKVYAKLGYGRHSTTWLCWDTKNEHGYVAVKVHSSNPNRGNSEHALAERVALETIESAIGRLIGPGHAGANRVRRRQDKFNIVRKRCGFKRSTHECFVFTPLGLSLADWRSIRPQRRLRIQDVKYLTFHLLLAIDFFHRKVFKTHGDIREENIMLEFVDPTAPRHIAELAAAHPSQYKLVTQNRKDKDPRHHYVYQSRTDLIHNFEGRLPILCDFDSVPTGIEQNPASDNSQELACQAPEVLLGFRWGTKADIWALGLLIWELVEGTPLFPKGVPKACLQPHLARMIQLLGAPPVELSSNMTGELNLHPRHFTPTGQLSPSLAALVAQLETDWVQEEKVLEGQEKQDFLQFIRPLFTWEAAQRPTARVLLESTWLNPHNVPIAQFNLDVPSQEPGFLQA